MLVSVEGPAEYQGEMIKTLMQRRGVIVGTTEDEGFVRVDANVPLAEMFGYAIVLRSAHGRQGRVHDGVRAVRPGAGRGHRAAGARSTRKSGPRAARAGPHGESGGLGAEAIPGRLPPAARRAPSVSE